MKIMADGGQMAVGADRSGLLDDHSPGATVTAGGLVTEELASRTRPRDFSAENRALFALSDAMAADPDTILQVLAETVLDILGAGSAGISVLEPGTGGGVFRWRAIAGSFAPMVGGTMPRFDSPCGLVVDTNATQLFRRPDLHFASLSGARSPLNEVLLTPFRLDGLALGTVWAIHHEPTPRFDLEDARLLASLANFAASAVRIAVAREAEASARRDAEERLLQVEALRDRQSVLIAEIQHRGRNLLGVVGAIAERTIGRGGSVTDYQNRLAALGRVQGLLDHPSAEADLGDVIRAELAPYKVEGSDRVLLEGPAVGLCPNQIQVLALAVHELTTNAVKYGALKSPLGRLAVRWSFGRPDQGRRSVIVDWQETGVTVPSEAMGRRGYGRELIERWLAHSLDAKTTYDLLETGLVCRLELPIGRPDAGQRGDNDLSDLSHR